jgi:antitoxin VapB
MKQGKETRIAKLFRNGRNQAVRLPKDYQIDAEEVYIRREGQNTILIPKPRSLDSYFANSRCLSDDFPDRIFAGSPW